MSGWLLTTGACTRPNPWFELGDAVVVTDAAVADVAVVDERVVDVAVADDVALEDGPGVPADVSPDGETPVDAVVPIDVSVPTDLAPDAPLPADMSIDVGPEAPPPVELVAGLLGYWRFDDDVRDSSGRGNNGAFEGPTGGTGFMTGRFGRAFQLSAPDRNFGIRVTATAAIRGIQRYTLAAWVYRTRNEPNEYCGIISRQIDNADGEVFNLMVSKDLIKTYGPDRNSATGTVTTASVPGAAPLNTWFHVASTFDGSRIRLYYNGIEQDFAVWTAALPTVSSPLYLATKKVINYAHPFIGALDEVMLYDRALPPEAVAALARGERPSVP